MPAYCKDDTPNACWDDIPAEDKEAAMVYAKLMGQVAVDILSGGGAKAPAPAAAAPSGPVDLTGLTVIAKLFENVAPQLQRKPLAARRSQ